MKRVSDKCGNGCVHVFSALDFIAAAHDVINLARDILKIQGRLPRLIPEAGNGNRLSFKKAAVASRAVTDAAAQKLLLAAESQAFRLTARRNDYCARLKDFTVGKSDRLCRCVHAFRTRINDFAAEGFCLLHHIVYKLVTRNGNKARIVYDVVDNSCLTACGNGFQHNGLAVCPA